MKIEFTQHALRRMAKRQLERAWIERAIENPAKIEQDENEPDLEHRLAIVPELADRVLRVIISKDSPHRVITMHLDRKLKGKL